MYLSFLMPVKNEDKYISAAIHAVLKSSLACELIVIDDGSNDQTWRILSDLNNQYSRLIILKNPGQGKVQALNEAYRLATGSIIKCIDGDDVLDSEFFSNFREHLHSKAIYHGFDVVSEDLNKIFATWIPGKSMMQRSFVDSVQGISSLPRCSWSFSKDIADKIFPMPENLPFEDVWISFMIKRFASNSEISRIPKPLYLYRQHSRQTYGGMTNFAKDKVLFRSKRLLSCLAVITEHWYRFEHSEKPNFQKQIRFHQAIVDSESKCLPSNWLGLKLSLKFVLIRYMPRIASWISILRWNLYSKIFVRARSC